MHVLSLQAKYMHEKKNGNFSPSVNSKYIENYFFLSFCKEYLKYRWVQFLEEMHWRDFSTYGERFLSGFKNIFPEADEIYLKTFK